MRALAVSRRERERKGEKGEKKKIKMIYKGQELNRPQTCQSNVMLGDEEAKHLRFYGKTERLFQTMS